MIDRCGDPSGTEIVLLLGEIVEDSSSGACSRLTSRNSTAAGSGSV
jgi:hypothetical protein